LETCQLAIGPHKKPRIPGEQTETLACRKGRHLSPRRQKPTQAPRRTGSSSVKEIARLNRSVSGTTTSLSCWRAGYSRWFRPS